MARQTTAARRLEIPGKLAVIDELIEHDGHDLRVEMETDNRLILHCLDCGAIASIVEI